MSTWVLRAMGAILVVLCVPYVFALFVALPYLLPPVLAFVVAFMASRRRARTVSSRAARKAARSVEPMPARLQPDPAWRTAWAAKEVERWGYIIPWEYPQAPELFVPGYVGITSQRPRRCSDGTLWPSGHSGQSDPDGTWWTPRFSDIDHRRKREQFALDYGRARLVPLGVLTETAAEQTWELPTIAQLCGQGCQLLNIIGNPTPWRA